jgi:hypothetical protein
MCVRCIVSVLALEHFFATKSVYECCPAYWTSHQLLLLPRRLYKGEYTSSRSTTDHKAELDTLLDILLPTNLDLQHSWVSTRMREHNVDVKVQPWHGTTTQRWVRSVKGAVR